MPSPDQHDREAQRMHWWRRLPRGGRALVVVWGTVLSGLTVLGGTLAYLGPPPNTAPSTSASGVAALPAQSKPVSQAPSRQATAPSAPQPPQTTVLSAGPHIALVLDGAGFSEELTHTARTLPAAISFTISPYLSDAAQLARALRAEGRDVLISLPMQASDSAHDDEGPRALGGTHTPQEDADALDWALAQIPQASGVTDLASGMTGGAFVLSADFLPVARTLAARHLPYVEGDPYRSRIIAGAGTDIAINGDCDAQTMDAALAGVLARARVHGQAIVTISPMTPLALARIAVWQGSLPQGTLVPVSALFDHLTTAGQLTLARETPEAASP